MQWSAKVNAHYEAIAEYSDFPLEFHRRGVDHAIDLLERAKREGAKGNLFGVNHYLSRAEDIYSMQKIGGSDVPGTATEIMRNADTGVRVTNGHKSRDDFVDKTDFINLVQQLNSTLTPPPSTLTGWLKVKELGAFKKKYAGRDTLRNWINEALPGTLKTGRPKKHTVIR